MRATPELLTVGKIAERIGCPIHRVEYAIKSQGIEESARAGTYRLFDDEAFGRVRSFIESNSSLNDSTGQDVSPTRPSSSPVEPDQSSGSQD